MRYYTYDTLSLKLFVEIINSGEFERVARSSVYDVEKCYMIWEQILMENARQEGSNKLGITFDSFKAYIRYSAVFVMVNAMLTKLQFIVDGEMITELKTLGYNISTDSSTKYAESIELAFNKLRNIKSKIQSKQIELEGLVKSGMEVQQHGLNFGKMLADISALLGFQVGKDILLSEYNQYVKRIREKQK